mgnify:CR=1 FL=1
MALIKLDGNISHMVEHALSMREVAEAMLAFSKRQVNFLKEEA